MINSKAHLSTQAMFRRQRKNQARSAQRNLIDFDVAQALVNYVARNEIMITSDRWGHVMASDVRTRLCVLRDNSNKVRKDKFIDWLLTAETEKMGGYPDKNLRHLIALIKRVK